MSPAPRRRVRGRSRLRRLTGLVLAAAVAALAKPQPTCAWGFVAHRMVNRKAIDTLPQPLRALFEGNADYLAEHAIDPDLWRAAGQPGEGPNHFLDLDAFGSPPFGDVPLDEGAHLRKHGPEAAERGRLPWRVAEVYAELVEAFRVRDPDRALERAAVLGHYAGDAHVPLHAVLNYDGQRTGQDGIHARWESALVERFAAQLEPAVSPRPAFSVRQPVAVVFSSLRDSFGAAAPVLDSDLACRGPRDIAGTPEDERYDHAYYSKLYRREASRLTTRLSASATAIGSLWRSAWEEAGRPALDVGFRIPYVRKATRAVLVSLDGSSAQVLDDAVARGLMPRLARLRASGATARGSLTALPAKTASGHAALFTGAWGDLNGIGGNWVQVPEASVLEMGSGFSSTPLRAEPLWAAAARQGLEVTVASGTQSFPWGPYTEGHRFGGSLERRLTLVDSYQNLDAPEAVYGSGDLTLRPASGWGEGIPIPEEAAREIAITVAGTRIDGLIYDDPADPVVGFDTLFLTLDKEPKDGVVLKPVPSRGESSAFAGLTLTVAGARVGAYFRLFTLDPEGRDLLLYRAPLHVSRSSRESLEAPLYDATGGLVGNGASRAYEEGRLGPPLDRGGNGTAEERYLETVSLVLRQFARLDDFAMARTSWDLFVTYRPYPDEALHLWYGFLDPKLPGHDRRLAERVRPYVDRLLRLVDDSLQPIVQGAGASAVIAVGGDHGMAGAHRIVRPNVALARAGLLGLDASGAVDLTRTRAVYFPGDSGFVLLNRAARPGGIVSPELEDAVRTEVRAALLAMRDPDTGKPMVSGVIDTHSADDEGLGGTTGGDLYLSLAPGYDVSAGLSGPLAEPITPRGVHFLDRHRPEMLVGFTIAGPGVASGADLGPIRQIDIAPTLAAILGIAPPAQAVGGVLTEALDKMRSLRTRGAPKD